MTDETEFEARLMAHTDSKLELLADWVAERALPVFASDPFTSEGANAFVALMRDFAAFLDEHLPFIDPELLPWIMYGKERAAREPTQEELRDVLFRFLRPEKVDRFIAEFACLAEAV